MANVQQLRAYVEQQKGSRRMVLDAIAALNSRIKERKRDLRRHEEAREIIREVGLKTQQQLQYHISDLTTLALEAVYDEPYQLVAEFVQRRNKTECDLLFERGGERMDPLAASGGGAVNIAAFALRVASWSMQRPRSNNVLVLDEPFGNVSVDLLPRASEMLQQISSKLGLQLVMVTHAEELIENADRTFRVIIKKGVSQVEQV
jgi:DNA repair exonuclease SbcCD ATPase subunit